MGDGSGNRKEEDIREALIITLGVATRSTWGKKGREDPTSLQFFKVGRESWCHVPKGRNLGKPTDCAVEKEMGSV